MATSAIDVNLLLQTPEMPVTKFTKFYDQLGTLQFFRTLPIETRVQDRTRIIKTVVGGAIVGGIVGGVAGGIIAGIPTLGIATPQGVAIGTAIGVPAGAAISFSIVTGKLWINRLL